MTGASAAPPSWGTVTPPVTLPAKYNIKAYFLLTSKHIIFQTIFMLSLYVLKWDNKMYSMIKFSSDLSPYFQKSKPEAISILRGFFITKV